MLEYPVKLDEAADGVTLTFPDVPEAVTDGEDRKQAMHHAVDALLTAVMIYEGDRRAFPLPAKVKAGTPTVRLPITASLKIFLHNAMVEQGMRKVDLMRATGWASPQVDRILDPRYASKVDLIETALAAAGKAVVGKAVRL
jgi:antitoxin HicB